MLREIIRALNTLWIDQPDRADEYEMWLRKNLRHQESGGVVVEIRPVRNERQAGSYTAYEFVLELKDGREALHVCKPGTYRITRIPDASEKLIGGEG